jgi:hypothetical protein
MSKQLTPAQIVRALAETVKESGDNGAPAGICYAALMIAGVTYDQFTAMVNLLVGAEIVTYKNHLLIWRGDEYGELGLFGERL